MIKENEIWWKAEKEELNAYASGDLITNDELKRWIGS